ncbi:MAG: hypothetical protein ACPLZY_03375 [Candidatus Norongarragalinales archaeon]
MGKITEIAITKGKTVRASEREEWTRVEYSLKAAVDEEAELQIAKSHIEGIIDGWLSAIKPEPTQQPKKPTLTVEEVQKAFPQELKALLTFTVSDDGSITVTPRQFLGAENFAKIADVVRSLGGEYVSAGKSSHFKIPPKGSGNV